ncbi:uncharacterized protein [Procambarus clarkii]|uniref:uncharacterized protein n=1 Tax=Procambarus clarkii TaxID=6728 RepID=UPI003743F7AC
MCSEVDFNLPSEVLEMVFSHVPLVHLLTVDATVCRYWYTVILNPAFIPWRKVHHRLKLAPWRVPSNMPLRHEWESEKLPTIHIISTHCQHHGFTSVRDCIPSVIKMCSEVDFNLPSEVLEMVFSHVPLVHLLTVDATVCRYWYTVILNPAFIPWRKVHHRLKLAPWRVPSNMPLHHEWESEKLPTIHIISTHCQHHGFTSVRDCIPSVIK